MKTLTTLVFSFLILSSLNPTFAQVYTMSSTTNGQTQITCEGRVQDNGGAGADYAANSDYSMTFCSSDGGPIRIKFDFVNVEFGWDFIYVHDGNNTGAPLLDQISGFCLMTNDCPGLVYTSSGTCLTIRFTSDNIQNYEHPDYYGGFQALLSCEPQGCEDNPPASDACSNATEICSLDGYCGNTSAWYTITAAYTDTYVGNSQFCGSIENDSWLTFTADDNSVELDVDVMNCSMNEGIQLVLFEGDCSNLTRVGTNCWNQLGEGSHNLVFNGLTPGQDYYLMFDGFAGDICDYEVNVVSGVVVTEIIDDLGGIGSASLCEGECRTLEVTTTGSPSGYNWYSDPASVTGSGSTVNVCPTEDMIVYAEVIGACGDAQTVDFVFDVTNIPDAPLVEENATYCEGDAIADLTATPGSGGTITWYNDAGLTSVAGTGTTFSPATTVGTHTYHVTEAVGDCESTASTVTITINEEPDAPVISGENTYCEGDAIADLSTSPTSGGTITWYNDAGLTSVAGTGNTLTPPSTVGTHTYYVTETLGDCESEATEATVIINETPDAPLVEEDATYCEGDAIADLTATPGSGGTITWYNDAGLTSVAGTGTTFSPATTVGTHTYHVTETLGSCESEASTVTIVVNETPDAPVVSGENTYCEGDAIADLSTSPTSGGTITWYNDAGLTSVAGTGNTLTPPSTVGTHTYYVTETLGDCESEATEATVIINETPDAPLVEEDATYCEGDAVTDLTATPGSGGDITWYNDAALTDIAGTGTTFSPATTVGIHTYHVTETLGSCESEASTVTIVVNETPDAPVVSGENTYCEGDAIADLSTSPTSGGAITWYNDAGLTSVAGTGNTLTPPSTVGTHTYYVTETLGDCESEATEATVIINETPDAPLVEEDATYCEEDAVADLTATLGSGGDITWYNDAGLTDVAGTGTTFSPATTVETHEYHVTETLGTCESEATIVTIIINEAPEISFSDVTNPACGVDDGEFTVNASGGTSPYDYSLDGDPFVSGGASETYDNLSSGNYTVTVQDANGCSVTDNVSLNNEEAPDVSIDVDQEILCFNGDNGELTAVATGGTGNLSYVWSPNGETTETISNLSPGTYSVTVTDENDCSASASVTLDNPDELTVNIDAQVNVSCFGENDGSITVSGDGGTGGYNFNLYDNNGVLLTGPQAGTTFDNLEPGTYVVEVIDDNGCLAEETFVIDEPTELTVDLVASSNITCFGDDDGSIEVEGQGGTPDYDYSLEDGVGTLIQGPQPTGEFINLSPDSYTVIVTDENGCEASIVVDITEPDDLVLTIDNLTDVSCNGADDGSIEASSTGGTVDYEYTLFEGTSTTVISGPQMDGNFNQLEPGEYTLEVVDENGCDASVTFEIIEPDDMALDPTVVDATCGDPDGEITVDVTGGTPDYEYTLLDGSGVTVIEGPQVGNNFTGLDVGTYTVSVTDDNGCETDIQVSIANIGAPDVNFTITSEISCFEECDGEITVEATSGDAPFEFVWEDSDGNVIQTNIDNAQDVLSGLCAGTYNIEVTDDSGNGPCPAPISVTITEPDDLAFDPVIENQNCTVGGSITFDDITGGTQPFEYSIDGGASFESNPNFEDVFAGDYDLVLSDANGCLYEITVTVLEDGNPPVVDNTITTPVTCFGDNDGIITVEATGQSNLEFSIDGTNFTAGNTFEDLPAGDHTVTIIDEEGCETTVTATVDSPDEILPDVIITDETCLGDEDGLLEVDNITGGNGTYTIFWEGSEQDTLGDLASGEYELTIVDQEGCEFSQTYTVGTNTFEGDFEANPTFGTVPLEVDFEYTGDTASFISWLIDELDSLNGEEVSYIFEQNGEYEVTMIATDGQCYDTLMITIVVEGESSLEIPNIFTPNGDGVNDLFMVRSEGLEEFNCKIYNRWGQQIFELFTPRQHWDGRTNSGVEASEGTYYVIIKAKGFDGVEYEMQSHVTLRR